MSWWVSILIESSRGKPDFPRFLTGACTWGRFDRLNLRTLYLSRAVLRTRSLESVAKTIEIHMLSVTFFFNQTDKIRFCSIWAINSFLGIWMTVEQIKLSGFFIRHIWPLQIGGRRKIRDRKTYVFFKKHVPKSSFGTRSSVRPFCALVWPA